MNRHQRWITWALLFAVAVNPASSRADIFRWDNRQVIPGTEGIWLGPWASLSNRDLAFADLHARNLTGVNFTNTNLANASLSQTMLTNAQFAGAKVTGARFGATTQLGLTKEQIYSTSSYKAKKLRGIDLGFNDLSGWDFSGQDLTDAYFFFATVSDADFTGAIVTGTHFGHADLTKAQLYSTASYQAKDLRGFNVDGDWVPANFDLTGWDLRGQDLSGASFSTAVLADAKLTGANLTGAYLGDAKLANADLKGANLTNANLWAAVLRNADLTGAIVTGATFSVAGPGEADPQYVTKQQIYSTASYKAKDLRGIQLGWNPFPQSSLVDLGEWDFSGQNLSGNYLTGVKLDNSNFAGANLTDANLAYSSLANANLTAADFRGASYTGLRLDGAIRTNLIAPDGRIDGLNLAAGDNLVAHAGVPIPVRIAGHFSIAPTATLDLTDNAAIVDYTGASPAATVRQRIVSGRGGPGLGATWTGMGITSSAAAAAVNAEPESRSVGYAENSALPLGPLATFQGQAVDDTSILMAFTRTGDANLDGVVNDDDVTIVGAMYAPGVPNASWAMGDVDYNGFVDDDDVTLLGAFYDPSAAPLNSQAAPGVDGHLQSSVQAVPEPSSAIMAAVVLAVAAALRAFTRRGLFLAFVAVFTTFAPLSRADIFRWDNGQLIPGTEGITPGPGVNLDWRELAFAQLGERDLTGASLVNSRLTRANLANSNLSRSAFRHSTLTDADLVGAVVTGTDFDATTARGFTKLQLYSTASYQVKDLRRISLAFNDLTGWDFSEQDLTSALLYRATLANVDFSGANLSYALLHESTFTNADFTGAVVKGANFLRPDSLPQTITKEQLYSTASYQANDLRGINLGNNNLAGWDFSGQDLTNAGFSSTVTGANLTGAIVAGASFDGAIGFTHGQLLSTASYQEKNLRGIGLWRIDLTGVDLSGIDLSNAYLAVSRLTGADLRGALVAGASFQEALGFTREQLYSTASYQAKKLQGISLSAIDLTGWDFREQNLSNANFAGATLTGANLTGAIVTGSNLWKTTSRGFTKEQLYSTASYHAKDLRSITLSENDLSAWDLSGQNLSNARLEAANVTGANLTGADARNAGLNVDFASAITTNMVFDDGSIHGLLIQTGQELVIRDYDGGVIYDYPFPAVPITVLEAARVAPGGRLQLVFEADDWNSTISFASGIPVELGGALGLTFAPDVDVVGQVGRTLDIFDWTGVTPAGQWEIQSPYVWDMTNLYTTGEVKLVAVPEPSAIAMGILGALVVLVACYRRSVFRRRHHNWFAAALLLNAACHSAPLRADIFRWDTDTVIPGTEGITPGPGVQLHDRGLEFAQFSQANLTGANFEFSNLANARFEYAVLFDANLTQAVVKGTNFNDSTLTKEQLYSTASYQAKDLRGIGLGAGWFNWSGLGMNLIGWDFSGQDLTGAYFGAANVTNANFTGAVVTGADLGNTRISKEQFYSTATFQAKNLQGIQLWSNDLTGWDFSGQNLANAKLGWATLTNANLAGAVVTGANFLDTTARGLTKEQIYSTASYQAKDLRGIRLDGNNLTGWDFSGQNLTDADLAATLTNVNLTGATIAGAQLYRATTRGLTREQLYSTASYQTKNLQGINLNGNDLSGWDFSGQNLSKGHLSETILTHANLHGANLREARIVDATIMNVNLTDANATLAKFIRSPVKNATVTRVDARGAEGLQITGAFTNLIEPQGRIYGLHLAAGERLVAYAGVPIPVTVVLGFSIAPDAKFDVTDNAVIIEYTGSASPAATVREQILSGRGGAGLSGRWTGTGITSSTAAQANNAQPDSRSLGYADNAAMPLGPYTTFHGESVDQTSILIAYTRTGDANLDGVVNDDDVTIVGATYAPGVPQPSWAMGDFDYNGFVDDDDVTLLGAFYNPSAPPLNSLAAPRGGEGLHSAASAIPEPSTGVLALLVLVVAGAIRAVVRRTHLLPLFIAATLTIGAAIAHADIFRWDNGRRIPGTEGIVLSPGIDLNGKALEFADLSHKNLRDANFTLTNLANATFRRATLTNASLAGAFVKGANFDEVIGFTKEQLYSTASYQAKDLVGISLYSNNITGWDFSGQDLTNASLIATLTSANLSGAIVSGTNFGETTSRGLTKEQLYSTASYATNNLQGIVLDNNDLAGWDFSGQNLTNAVFYFSKLKNTNLAGAIVTGTNFLATTATGFTKEQLYSTASYQAKDLRSIGLSGNDLTGWNLSGQNLTGADFAFATLTNADMSGAVVTGTRFLGTTSLGFTKEQLYSTASYQAKDLRGLTFTDGWFGVGTDVSGWDFSGQNLADASFVGSTLTNVNLSGAVVARTIFSGAIGLTKEQIYSTASYRAKNLQGIGLGLIDLAGGDFRGQDLTGASLHEATLANADLSGAVVAGAAFSKNGFDVGGSTITKDQLYSTASYQAKDLREISLVRNDLTSWNFSGQNLTGAYFDGAKLTNADLSFADTRGVYQLDLAGALATNLIRPDGRIVGLNLAAGEKLVAYPGVPVPVKFGADFTIVPTATFDLTDNAAIVDYAGASPEATVREQILAGRGGAALGAMWNGAGITSSAAAAANKSEQNSRSLGYTDNASLPLGPYATFHGSPVDSTSVLIAYTRTGDANLDGVVNDDDVTIVGATYAPGVPQPSWALGDFDYNGFVDDDDVTLLGAFYDPSAAPLASPAPPGGDGGLPAGVSAVPEPGTLLLAAIAMIAFLRPMRRRR
jgi:uncharacterized protein YjbI with pentapeptide repeats